MTMLRLLETLCSLSLQVAVVVAATGYLARRFGQTDRLRDQLWNGCWLALVLICVGDVCFPHPRLLPVPAAVCGPELGLTVEQQVNALSWLAGLWLAGASVMLARLVLGALRTVWLIRQARPIEADRLPQPWGLRPVTDNGAATSGATDAIRFLSTGETLSPFCWQLHRPTIVLPEVVLSFSAEELVAVIRHEAAHLTYAHPLWLFVQRLVESVLWFHPALWWAARRACASREFVCDSAAANMPGEAAALLRSLLRLAEFGCSPARSRLANGATGDRGSILAERAERLSRPGRAPLETRRWPLSLLPAALACAVMAVLWIPIDTAASTRSLWSPWPAWSASALQSLGIPARDYEIDGHRLRPYHHSD